MTANKRAFRILIVERDSPPAERLSAALRGVLHGESQVQEARTLKAASFLVGRERFDAVLAQNDLADGKGATLLRSLLMLRGRAAHYFLLARARPSDPEVVALLKEFPQVNFVETPYDPDAVARLVIEALAPAVTSDQNFYGLRLCDLIQMYSLARRDATVLVLLSNGGMGSVSMRGGEIVHAVFGELEGFEALLEMVRSRKGEIRVTNTCATARRSLNKPTQQLLIDIYRRMDEDSATGQSAPQANSPAAQKTPAARELGQRKPPAARPAEPDPGAPAQPEDPPAPALSRIEVAAITVPPGAPPPEKVDPDVEAALAEALSFDVPPDPAASGAPAPQMISITSRAQGDQRARAPLAPPPGPPEAPPLAGSAQDREILQALDATLLAPAAAQADGPALDSPGMAAPPVEPLKPKPAGQAASPAPPEALPAAPRRSLLFSKASLPPAAPPPPIAPSAPAAPEKPRTPGVPHRMPRAAETSRPYTPAPAALVAGVPASRGTGPSLEDAQTKAPVGPSPSAPATSHDTLDSIRRLSEKRNKTSVGAKSATQHPAAPSPSLPSKSARDYLEEELDKW